MNTEMQLSNIERQTQIVIYLKEHKRIGVNTICSIFSISEATARRDLEELAQDGRVQRVRGGAIALEKSPPELPILIREGEQKEEKQCIGKAAAKLVETGDTVFLGSGTTVLEVAKCLYDHQGLTIITNSLPVINALVGRLGIKLIIIGGILRDSELSFIGHITEKALSEVHADKVILGARAISLENGLTNDYLNETLTDRAIIKSSEHVILVADNTKCGSISTAFLAPLSDIDTFVTDSKTDPEFIQSLREMGIHVISA